MQSIELKPIGVVKSPVTDASTINNWGKVTSEIHINQSLTDGLQGVNDWSHLIVIFVMHETEYDEEKHLVRRPRNRDDMPELGIFAQRSRNHPNQIGITAVRLLAVENQVVRVKGLDAIDGTPVLDIKPYAPVYDGVSDSLVPAWFIRLMQGYF
ncbi:MAG: tRNA (N6-threonylcarbamoyladenosine(37)-N6)-methyltransferase TrmO [Anaerolineae bacterium]|nr:tRNA (N6-threonylcarbamoyladenosine(37)-N6)-methyltransferase TrmO [Anaerolineae bacterium]MDQ7036843.1 tRNA (N6-threonylcarbamoyladenosine(37)-N6)-methyltransferase TrmO [Anaerolineae bacterium]